METSESKTITKLRAVIRKQDKLSRTLAESVDSFFESCMGRYYATHCKDCMATVRDARKALAAYKKGK